jgi:hypothetical protein
MLRHLLGTIALLFLLVDHAAGCTRVGTGTIFLDQPLPGIIPPVDPLYGVTAPVIAGITVTRIIHDPNDPTQTYVSGGRKFYGYYVVDVRVEYVLSGVLAQDDIRMIAPGGSCGPELRVGSAGIVAGRLETSPEGERQLVALLESRHDRHARTTPPK